MNTYAHRPPAPAAAPAHRPAAHTTPGRPIAAVLLAAAVAALAGIVSQLMDTWADEHLFAAWVALWAVVFAGSLFLAGTAQRIGQRVMQRLNAWGRDRAQARAETRRRRFGHPPINTTAP
ncbi:hypothetical protein [Macromonas nakdongensis]|uniref:hypothetical protein n=1 Tax=Macromonas nakdongensis TaxID=1843082 RepID=UPI000C3401CD|nr:hypothetical protein [Macromonas nakdongensis]